MSAQRYNHGKTTQTVTNIEKFGPTGWIKDVFRSNLTADNNCVQINDKDYKKPPYEPSIGPRKGSQEL